MFLYQLPKLRGQQLPTTGFPDDLVDKFFFSIVCSQVAALETLSLHVLYVLARLSRPPPHRRRS